MLSRLPRCVPYRRSSIYRCLSPVLELTSSVLFFTLDHSSYHYVYPEYARPRLYIIRPVHLLGRYSVPTPSSAAVSLTLFFHMASYHTPARAAARTNRTVYVFRWCRGRMEGVGTAGRVGAPAGRNPDSRLLTAAFADDGGRATVPIGGDSRYPWIRSFPSFKPSYIFSFFLACRDDRAFRARQAGVQ